MYTKAGIMLDELAAIDLRLRTLFEDDTAKWERLMGALDGGDRIERFKREWKLRSEMRSPSWTTSIAEMPTVRA